MVTLDDSVEKELRQYVGREFPDKRLRGGLSIIVEEAVRRFLEERTGRRLT